jgi:DNA-binding CsgD family transcriptional regulator
MTRRLTSKELQHLHSAFAALRSQLKQAQTTADGIRQILRGEEVRSDQQAREAIRLRNREVLIAHEQGLESQSQIAARLGTTPGAVAQVIRRNRLKTGVTIRRSTGRKPL